MKKITIAICILLTFDCAAVKLVIPGQADADRGAQKFAGYTLNDLNQGKAIYESHCNKCHRFKAPPSRSETKWNTVIPKMAKKAKLDPAEQDLVLKYVVTMCTVKPS